MIDKDEATNLGHVMGLVSDNRKIIEAAATIAYLTIDIDEAFATIDKMLRHLDDELDRRQSVAITTMLGEIAKRMKDK